jgi:hypothetical protein
VVRNGFAGHTVRPGGAILALGRIGPPPMPAIYAFPYQWSMCRHFSAFFDSLTPDHSNLCVFDRIDVPL